MPSQALGVQKRVKYFSKKVVHTHCCGHNLNLEVVLASKIPVVHNVLDIAKNLSKLFVKVCIYYFHMS